MGFGQAGNRGMSMETMSVWPYADQLLGKRSIGEPTFRSSGAVVGVQLLVELTDLLGIPLDRRDDPE